MAFTQANQYLSITTPLGEDKLLIRSIHGEERISGLFHFFVEAVSEDKALDFSLIVGKSATVKLALADGSTTRYVNGIVGRFVQAGSDARFFTYYLELHPWFWMATMSADCRIWQNKTVIEIVTGLFDELGFTDYKNSTTGTYAALEYCVQYNESAFAFVSRLLEDHGIFYFFEHEDGKHTLVLADAATAFADCPGAATVDYATYGVWAQQNIVTSLAVEQAVIPGKYAVDDFGFETPSTDLMGSTDSTKATNGTTRRIYEYPGGFVKKDAAEGKAKLRMEEKEVPQKMLRGTSFVPRVVSRREIDAGEALSRRRQCRLRHCARLAYRNARELFEFIRGVSRPISSTGRRARRASRSSPARRPPSWSGNRARRSGPTSTAA